MNSKKSSEIFRPIRRNTRKKYAFEELAVAQKNTEIRLEKLTESVDKLTERVDPLTALKGLTFVTRYA